MKHINWSNNWLLKLKDINNIIYNPISTTKVIKIIVTICFNIKDVADITASLA